MACLFHVRRSVCMSGGARRASRCWSKRNAYWDKKSGFASQGKSGPSHVSSERLPALLQSPARLPCKNASPSQSIFQHSEAEKGERGRGGQGWGRGRVDMRRRTKKLIGRSGCSPATDTSPYGPLPHRCLRSGDQRNCLPYTILLLSSEDFLSSDGRWA